jgi:succinate dehydrogenase/fumarate reductase iron-sulfur protein
MPTVAVAVSRSAEPGQKPRLEEHCVELSEKASVLDALLELQRGPCPDLAFRFSCRVGMCGSCAMVVNGREQLACSTLVKDVGAKLRHPDSAARTSPEVELHQDQNQPQGGRRFSLSPGERVGVRGNVVSRGFHESGVLKLRIEPLRNLPVTRDLAVDLKPFFAAYKRVLPQFIPRADLDPGAFYPLPHESKEWKALNHQPQCIDCGACYSACTLVSLHPRYAGPMALHRALNLIVDPRDGARAQRLALVTGEAGAFRCHTLGNCREVCPRGISPTQSIERLKRLAVLEQFTNLLGGWFGASKRNQRNPAA